MAGVSYDEVMQWSVDDVLGWLRKNNLAEFQDFVCNERIDGPDFMKLDKGRISNCKNVTKSKRELLLKRIKDFEKEKLKAQKTIKGFPKTANGRPAPAVKALPPPARSFPSRIEDDGEDDFDDDDEWDDDQGIYDPDQTSQPPKGRRSELPPPPPPTAAPNDDEDGEDYEKPGVGIGSNTNLKSHKDHAPCCRPPPPPPPVDDDDDDDNLYEKANPPMIPVNLLPRNPPAQPPMPPPPAQGPPPPRGGRAPVLPPHHPILYEESEPVIPPPPPRKASPPPPPISRSNGTKNSAPPVLHGRAALPVPQPGLDELYETTDEVVQLNRVPPQEINEHPDQEEKPPSLPSCREARALPPRPSSEDYDNPKEQESTVPDYESVEEVKAKMGAAPPQRGGRANIPPPPQPILYVESEPTQAPSAVHKRAPVPVPTDDSDDMYEATDSVIPPPPPPASRSANPAKSRALPPQPVQDPDDELYEATPEDDPPQIPPSYASSSNATKHRALPPQPVQDPDVNQVYEATDEPPQINKKREDSPPQKPEKLQLGFKVFGGVPPIGIGVESVAVREARKGLRKAMPNDFHTEAKDKPTLNPDEPKTVGGIKQMFQEKARLQPPVKTSKATPVPPKTARTAVLPPSPSTTEINAPGAPEPPRPRQGRAPSPGPPGGPPEKVNSPAVVALPVPDSNDITTQPWYFGNCGRKIANAMLEKSTEGGTYLVRDSTGSGQPYTLGLYYQKDVFNIAIRKRPDGKFALGSEKPDEHVFESIYDMIRFHRNNAIEVSKNGVLTGRVKLAKVAEK